MANIFYNVDIWSMTRDPASIANIHPMLGILSNLGVLLWCATGAICFFTSITFHKVLEKKKFKFLLFSGLFSTYLLCDDLFQIHEFIALVNQDGIVYIVERLYFVVLGIIALLFLFVFLKIILTTQFYVLLLALLFFSCSVIFDNILTDWVLEKYLGIGLNGWFYLLEDGFKWLGIVCWSGYFIYTSYQFINSTFKSSSDHSKKNIG